MISSFGLFLSWMTCVGWGISTLTKGTGSFKLIWPSPRFSWFLEELCSMFELLPLSFDLQKELQPLLVFLFEIIFWFISSISILYTTSLSLFVAELFTMWLKMLSTSGRFFFSLMLSIADRTWGFNKSKVAICNKLAVWCKSHGTLSFSSLDSWFNNLSSRIYQ